MKKPVHVKNLILMLAGSVVLVWAAVKQISRQDFIDFTCIQQINIQRELGQNIRRIFANDTLTGNECNALQIDIYTLPSVFIIFMHSLNKRRLLEKAAKILLMFIVVGSWLAANIILLGLLLCFLTESRRKFTICFYNLMTVKRNILIIIYLLL